MSNYLEKYKEAARNGDMDEAHEYYKKYRDESMDVDAGVSTEEVKEDDDESVSEFDPKDHTVGDVKEEVEDYSDEQVSAVLRLEKDGKNRTTLVNHLEQVVE